MTAGNMVQERWKEQRIWIRFSHDLYVFEPWKKSEHNFIEHWMKEDDFVHIKGK